jgi:hypothetical protein
MERNMEKNRKMMRLKRSSHQRITIKIRNMQMITMKRKSKTYWKIMKKIPINKSKR